jgi:hypothetical protein
MFWLHLNDNWCFFLIFVDFIFIKVIYMQFDVDIRLYEYWHEQVKIRKKRWNNKEIKKFYWK